MSGPPVYIRPRQSFTRSAFKSECTSHLQKFNKPHNAPSLPFLSTKSQWPILHHHPRFLRGSKTSPRRRYRRSTISRPCAARFGDECDGTTYAGLHCWLPWTPEGVFKYKSVQDSILSALAAAEETTQTEHSQARSARFTQARRNVSDGRSNDNRHQSHHLQKSEKSTYREPSDSESSPSDSSDSDDDQAGPSLLAQREGAKVTGEVSQEAEGGVDFAVHTG
ncbi:hypothetical protein K504DRAFT_496382 [Pleomassaria siparia CBS 279.74]|uniref:Uncharacterized protein n=1 Tax=Pleomassaria siparia CBS 279.74 TaxID=1314801 RepID=A0A6G1KNN3_9PLEO|nr:hypothetical protein K504DRAFT_496382 [Pleomassaria siparia CBS 279.74]